MSELAPKRFSAPGICVTCRWWDGPLRLETPPKGLCRNEAVPAIYLRETNAEQGRRLDCPHWESPNE